jgi:serine/threonine protein kinase
MANLDVPIKLLKKKSIKKKLAIEEDEIIDKRVVISGEIKFEHISSWTIQLLEGLIFIHGKNLIHRDLKPA